MHAECPMFVKLYIKQMNNCLIYCACSKSRAYKMEESLVRGDASAQRAALISAPFLPQGAEGSKAVASVLSTRAEDYVNDVWIIVALG